MFHIIELMGQSQRRRVCFVEFARWRHPGRRLHLVLSCGSSTLSYVIRGRNFLSKFYAVYSSGAKYCISVSVCLYVFLPVCLSVCPLAYLKNHMSRGHEILCTCYLWSSSDHSAVCYVLPVLWMASCFHIMWPMGQNSRRRYVSSSLIDGGTGGEVAVYDCMLVVVDIVIGLPAARSRVQAGL